MPFNLETPQEILLRLKERMKTKRLQINLTQEGLALRADVSLGTVKHFEKSGKISFENLLSLAMALGCLDDFAAILKGVDTPTNLFAENKAKNRKRGRIK